MSSKYGSTPQPRLLLGAWTSPLLYGAGKAIAEICSTRQTNGPLEWLAGICRTHSCGVISGAALKQGLAPLTGILLAGFLVNYLTAPADDTDTPA